MIKILIIATFTLIASSGVLIADEPRRDELWSQFRGPSHGRGEIADAPGPPLKLKWTLDLWDPNKTGFANDCILFAAERPWELSPAGIGIAWRMDQKYLYAFEIGFYTSGKQIAVFDRLTGELLGKTTDAKSQPLASKRVASIHDDPGFGDPLVFHGNFYSGQRLYSVDAAGQLSALQLGTINMENKIAGHACEGPRWLQGKFYLNGAGAHFKDGPSYRWGSHLVRWGPGEHEVVLRDVSVPCAVWDQQQLVLFARGGLSGKDSKAVFSWQDYIRIGVKEDKGVILSRRRVTDRAMPTGDDLFEDPAPVAANDRMINRARNVVNAMAISVDGQFVYCQERTSANQQRIVRRRLDDFSVDGSIPAKFLPPVTEQSTFGQVNVELGIGMALDEKQFYLHLVDTIHALSLDLKTVAWSAKIPARRLNGHCPFSMSRHMPRNNNQYAVRGTENTVAVSGPSLYLTTDTTLQVHSTATGEVLWSHEFQHLPRYSKKVAHPYSKGKQPIDLLAAGYPGDVLLADDAVYVSTHGNQSHLYCFVPDPETNRSHFPNKSAADETER